MKRGHKCAVGVIIGIVLGTASHYVSNDGNSLRFSKAGMDIIGNAEDCRRDPYRCPAGKLTQGIGHTNGTIPKDATNEQIANWFATDLLNAQNCIERYVEEDLGEELPQPIFDAVGSFIFNVGCTKFVHSSMRQFLIEQEYGLACGEFPRWVYVGRNKMAGLIKRRAQEMSLCLDGLST